MGASYTVFFTLKTKFDKKQYEKAYKAVALLAQAIQNNLENEHEEEMRLAFTPYIEDDDPVELTISDEGTVMLWDECGYFPIFLPDEDDEEEIIEMTTSKPSISGLICFYAVWIIMKQYLPEAQCQLDRIDNEYHHQYDHGIYVASLIEPSCLSELPEDFIPDEDIKIAIEILKRFISVQKQEMEAKKALKNHSLFKDKQTLTSEDASQHPSKNL